jgi:hypothetical protein
MYSPRRLFSSEQRIQRFTRRTVERLVRSSQAGSTNGRRIVARDLEAGGFSCDGYYRHHAGQ